MAGITGTGRYLHYRPADIKGADCEIPQTAAVYRLTAGGSNTRTQAASWCTYIRAWLIQVSGHTRLTHTVPPVEDTVLSLLALYAIPLCTYISAWLSLLTRRTYTNTATGRGYGPWSTSVEIPVFVTIKSWIPAEKKSYWHTPNDIHTCDLPGYEPYCASW